MKVSKRLLIGVSTIVGALTVGGVALYSMPRGDAGEPQLAEEEPQNEHSAQPLVDPAAQDLNPEPPAPAFVGDNGMPSPPATVRANDQAYDPGGLELGPASDSAYAASPTSDVGDLPPASPYTPSSGYQTQPDLDAPAAPSPVTVSDNSQYNWPPAPTSEPAPTTYSLSSEDAPAAPSPDAYPAARTPDAYPPAPVSGTVTTSVGDDANYGNAYAEEPGGYAERQPLSPPPLRAEVTSPEPVQYQPDPRAVEATPYEPPAPNPGLVQDARPAEPQQYRGALGAAPLVAELARPKPGNPLLEGVQTPSLAVQKSGPAEIQINIPAAFEVVVRNVGTAKAHGVTLTDVVPQGTQLISTQPEARQGGDGSLVWDLGELEPGDERRVTLEVLPQMEGDIGSVAQVSFQAAASVRALCTRPLLKLDYDAPDEVLIGEDAVISITVSNPGTGAATDVIVEGDVPEQLTHPAGNALESAIGTLAPGETRAIKLVLQADQAGQAQGRIRVRGNGKLLEEEVAQIHVIAPKLAVNIDGPKQRYVEREVTYEISFFNSGTAAAKNVDLIAYLPKGLEFLETENKGRYDAEKHAVLWSLVELPSQGQGAVRLRAVPLETGAQVLRVEANADLGLSSQLDFTTNVDSLTELEFSIADTHDPIEENSETTYEVRVVNNGAKVARNVQLAATVPAELQITAADGSSETQIQGQVVRMDAIAELAPRAEASYRIKVVGLREGDHVIEVRMLSDEVQAEVIKQESTKVYRDR